MQYKYYQPDCGEGIEDATLFKTNFDDRIYDIDSVAGVIADYIVDNMEGCDGYDDTYEFVIVDAEGKEHKYQFTVDWSPTAYVTKVE